MTKDEQIEQLQRQNEARGALLKRLEWVGRGPNDIDEFYCPVCKAHSLDSDAIPHEPNCLLAAALRPTAPSEVVAREATTRMATTEQENDQLRVDKAKARVPAAVHPVRELRKSGGGLTMPDETDMEKLERLRGECMRHLERVGVHLDRSAAFYDKLMANAPKCGACAEALFCGSVSREHDPDCVHSKFDEAVRLLEAVTPVGDCQCDVARGFTCPACEASSFVQWHKVNTPRVARLQTLIPAKP